MEEMHLSSQESVKQEPVKKEDRLISLEEKIDKVLKYQKFVRGIAIFRGIISFIFFLVFIVLPIIGGFYLFQYLREHVDFDKIGSQYIEFRETLDELKEKSGQVGNLNDLLKQPQIPQQ